MAALYAGWGFSEPFYREEVFRAFGARDVPEFIDFFWDTFFLKCDANDLLAQMWTWWHNDLGDHPRFGGDFDAALASIRARTITSCRPRRTPTSRPSTRSTRQAGSRTPSAG
jgi:homoserine O-acetyltransferase